MEKLRQNVGIALLNSIGQFFWAKRMHQDAWQFPQGGIHPHETVESALFRELHEEIGLREADVRILGCSSKWLTYSLPEPLLGEGKEYTGQKQKWFLLKLCAPEETIQLHLSASPEFEKWRWVSYWFPLHQVVFFKKEVYRQMLLEFVPLARTVI